MKPQLEYTVHLWSPYQIALREKLEQSQRRTKKLVGNISYEKRLLTLNLISTLVRQDRCDMIMTYNILNHRVEMDDRFMKMKTEDIPRNLK